MKNIIIPKPKKLEKIKKAMTKDGAKKLHLLSDFDRTLTNFYVNGKKVSSLISLLDKNFLTPEYHQQYQTLYNKYFPIEINPKISLKKKKKMMAEWWQAVFDLLIASKLNKKDLKKLVALRKVKLRNGFNEFINYLRDKKIPLVIMSATGLGGDVISIYLKKEKKLHPNIYLIANAFNWNKKGEAISVKKPIVHVANKDETLLKKFPFFDKIKKRTNVILLGDAIEDIGMVKGFDYKNLIKIGFLNDKKQTNLKKYISCFDVVVLNDSDLEYVNELLKAICH